ncbi:hypothetical protein BV25DRAFT_1783348, partial [Artomyces pyxidatus]
FFPDVQRFRDALRCANAVISGSFALNIALHCCNRPAASHWRPNDMDLYCGIHHYVWFLTYLIRVEGYLPMFTGGEQEQCLVPHYGGGGIALIFRLVNSRGRQLDVICADSESALTPIPHFWGTLVVNYVSADEICVAYPRLTLNGIGYINPARIGMGTNDAIEKYAARGFTITPFTDNNDTHPLFPPNAHCPHSLRGFDDVHSLRIRLGDTLTEHSTVPHLVWCPRWRWAGPSC